MPERRAPEKGIMGRRRTNHQTLTAVEGAVHYGAVIRATDLSGFLAGLAVVVGAAK